MKKLVIVLILLTGTVPLLSAQHLTFQSEPTINTTTLFEKVTKLEKKTEWFNVYLNMQGSFNIFFNDIMKLYYVLYSVLFFSSSVALFFSFLFVLFLILRNHLYFVLPVSLKCCGV